MRFFGTIVLALTGGAAAAQTAVSPMSASYAPSRAEPLAVLSLVNDIRRAEGLDELQLDGALMSAAADYAADLALRGALDHAGADGSAPPDRANAAGYPGRYVAENLAAGYDDAAALVGDWMESPSHRATILLERATDLGVGQASAAPGDTYWTLLVAAPAVRVAE